MSAGDWRPRGVSSDALMHALRNSGVAGLLQLIAPPVRIMVDMKILNFIHVTVAQAFYRWALSEIDPMHPDLPRIVRRQRELADKASGMFA